MDVETSVVWLFILVLTFSFFKLYYGTFHLVLRLALWISKIFSSLHFHKEFKTSPM
jgi:hypothetical protein